MYETIKSFHSTFAFLALGMLIITIVWTGYNYFTDKPFEEKHRKLALFTFVSTHVQLLFGLILYFTSPAFASLRDNAKMVMGDKTLRLLIVEHPFTNLLAIALITVGYVQHKKLTTDKEKNWKIFLFYGIGLILLLSRIPFANWLEK
jgi:RsiW-degrading membrane proteinase PrsW (M82 family)